VKLLIVILLVLILAVLAPGLVLGTAGILLASWKTIVLYSIGVAVLIGLIALFDRWFINRRLDLGRDRYLKRIQRVADEANRRNQR